MHTWVHTSDTRTHHHTYVDTHTCHHMCVHILPDPQKPPPATHTYTSSHSHTSKHIRGVPCWARTLPRACARHHTCIPHVPTPRNTHMQGQTDMCTIRHIFTCTFTCSDTYTRTHTPCSGPGCHTGDQHHMASKVSMVGRSQTHPGHRGPWADPRRMLPHVLPPRQGSASRCRGEEGTGNWRLLTACSVPGAPVNPGLILFVWLAAHCSRPQAEGFSQGGLDASRADTWAR